MSLECIARGYRALAVGVLFLLFAGGSWSQEDRELESSPRFRFECRVDKVSGKTDPACAQSSSDAERDAVATLEAVRDWFDSLGYPHTLMPHANPFSTPKDKSGVISRLTLSTSCSTPQPDADLQTPEDSALACVVYEKRYGLPRIFRIPVSLLQGDPLLRDESLAHESAHTLVKGNVEASRFRWINEAIAEAIGLQWLETQGKRPFPMVHPNFAMDLDLPFHEGNQGGNPGYEKAPYFRFLGDRMGGPELGPLRYLEKLFENWPDENESVALHPMAMLYEPRWIREDVKFPKVFPEFVAKYNNPTEQSSEGVGRYYETVATSPLPEIQVGTSFSRVLNMPEVAPFAASAAILSVASITADQAVKKVDRLAVVRHEVVKASAIDHLSLVFEHEATTNGRHSYLTLLDPTYFKDTGFLRITNAGDTPAATQAQRPALELRIDPVAFPIPTCIRGGEPTTFRMRGASASDVRNFRLEASAGRFEDMVYHPPKKATRKVEFSVLIESPITRASKGIAPVRRPEIRVDLGTQAVSDDSCYVRMTLDGAGNPRVVATQDIGRQFTEYTMPDGASLYARTESIQAKSNGRWSEELSTRFLGDMLDRILPMMGANSGQFGNLLGGMLGSNSNPVLGMMLNGIPLGNLGQMLRDSGTSGGIFGLYAGLPVTITTIFNRETIAGLLGDEQMRPSLVGCPDGSGECEQYAGTVQNHELTATFNTQGELVHLVMDQQKLAFEYGVPTDDIPPTWH